MLTRGRPKDGIEFRAFDLEFDVYGAETTARVTVHADDAEEAIEVAKRVIAEKIRGEVGLVSVQAHNHGWVGERRQVSAFGVAIDDTSTGRSCLTVLAP